MSDILTVSQLVAGYGRLAVVHNLDLRVAPGEIVALAGPNGAGKTTTLMSIAGALRPISGAITIGGRRVDGARPHQVRRAGGYLIPENRGVLGGLTVMENLLLRHRGRHSPDVRSALASFPELKPLLNRRARLLSGGEQQMLALAAAQVARPQVLIIDELSHGLAPVVVARLGPALRHMAQEDGIAVLLVEQHITVALHLAGRAYIMRRGVIELSGDAAALEADLESIEATYFGIASPPHVGSDDR